MSPSLLGLYMDRAEERIKADAVTRLDELVAAVRIGGADQKSFARWLRKRRARATSQGHSLTGAALERAVAGVAAIFPQNVVRAVA